MEEMCAAHTCASSLDVETIRKDFPILSTQVHGRELVYLDNAATTQVPLQVTDAVAQHYAASNANVHRGMHYLAHPSPAARFSASAEELSLGHTAATRTLRPSERRREMSPSKLFVSVIVMF